MHTLAAEERIFPTRVGMVRAGRLRGGECDDFPHTRGDGPGVRVLVIDTVEFSPHAWGWSYTPDALRHNVQIFPTRVGMVLG